VAGCREQCCRDAISKHQNMRLLAARRGTPYTVPSIGVIRRVRALMRIGWRSADIAEVCGWSSAEAVTNLMRRKYVNHKTAATIRAAYDQLSGTPGASIVARRRAEAAGWPPPLAWDDIDDPNARPVGVRTETAA
jgi:hypothetical protein